MKAQMSLEMMAYLALAGIAMLCSVSVVSEYSTKIARYGSSYSYSEFMESLATAIMSSASGMNAYVPIGLCNSRIEDDIIATTSGNFTMALPIAFVGNVPCNGGTYDINISYANGTASLVFN